MKRRERVRFFTVEEANRTLPLVRRIVEDILAEHERLERLIGELGAARARRSAELPELRRTVAASSSALEEYLAELHAVGCLFKGSPEGLVDFYHLRGGRPVFLCWKLGEEEVAFWHELEAGYRGREPLTSGALPSSRRGYGPQE